MENVDEILKTTATLLCEDYYVEALDRGIRLFVRNKRRPDIAKFPAEKIVLYVHGATYPSETAFDLRLDGYSWMDYIACRGFDVYLLDVRGYSRSTRPPEMSRPAADNPPIVTTEVAARDVAAVVENILARREAKKLNLIGWSWGTGIMGTYTAKNSGKVAKLVLYGAQWLRTAPSLTDSGGPLGAYRCVDMRTAKPRWLTGVPENKREALIPPGWYEKWAEATQATDPEGAAQNPPVLRAPNGVVHDSRVFWLAGRPVYDPALITVPVLLINGAWDADTPYSMAQGLFGQLVNTPYKRWVVIDEATHTVIMERNRRQLFREVQLFMEESRP